MKISATIITLNEETNIRRALQSLDFADEIVVVDSGSTDKTCEIAESFGAKLFFQDWLGFSKQKQLAVEKASYDFIFSLDADEEVSPELRTWITQLKALPEDQIADGFRIPRLSYYMNRPIRHSGWYPDYQLRLFNRKRGFWKDVAVHESIKMEANSKIEIIKQNLLHFSVESASHHHKMIGERYAPLAAKQMFLNGKRTNRFRICSAGIITFITTYFLKLGFLDGLPGFAIAQFAAHHAFLKHLLLWEIQQKEATE